VDPLFATVQDYGWQSGEQRLACFGYITAYFAYHDTWRVGICEQYSAFTSTYTILPKLALADKR
jgi:hypothetical protein